MSKRVEIPGTNNNDPLVLSPFEIAYSHCGIKLAQSNVEIYLYKSNDSPCITSLYWFKESGPDHFMSLIAE